PAPPPGDPVMTFAGGVDKPPLLAIGPSASGMSAGVAWVHGDDGFPTFAYLGGQGQLIGEPAIIENGAARGYGCLGFTSGKGELTINYQRGSLDDRLGPNWMIADVDPTGGVNTLNLNVAQPLGTMTCAQSVLYDPMTGAPPEW